MWPCQCGGAPLPLFPNRDTQSDSAYFQPPTYSICGVVFSSGLPVVHIETNHFSFLALFGYKCCCQFTRSARVAFGFDVALPVHAMCALGGSTCLSKDGYPDCLRFSYIFRVLGQGGGWGSFVHQRTRIMRQTTNGLGGLARCKRSATIWACGPTRDPYFVILGGHHCCLRVGFDTSSTLGVWHFWIFT